MIWTKPRFSFGSLILLMVTNVTQASAFNWVQSADLTIRSGYLQHNQPSVDPEQLFLTYNDYESDIYGTVNIQKSLGQFSIFSQVRSDTNYVRNAENVINDESSLFVDELYIDFVLANNWFINIGKRNIVNGGAVGFNPTDYFGEGKIVDLRLGEQERKQLRKGDYILSAEWLGLNSGLSLIFSPDVNSSPQEQSRFLLRYDQLLPSLNGDFSSLLFFGDRPGVGFSYSQTLNENLLWYSEISFRDERDRSIANITESTNDNIYVEANIGSNYTFRNGLNWYTEYWYMENGYDDREWAAITNLIDTSSAQLNTPNRGNGLAQLVAVNQGFQPIYLRQHYLFNRLHYGIDNKKFTMVYIQSLESNSGFTRLTADIETKSGYFLGLQLEYALGSNNEEFRMRSQSNYFGINVKFLL